MNDNEWLTEEMRQAGYSWWQVLHDNPRKDAASNARKSAALRALNKVCIGSGHDRYDVLRVLEEEEEEKGEELP